MDTESGPTLEVRDAARQIGVPIRKLYDLIDRSELPAYKDGRNIKLRQADVDAYRRDHPAAE